MIVVDASALVELLLDRRGARTIRDHVDDEAHAPHLVDVEVWHAMRRWTMNGRIPTRRAEAALGVLETLPVTRHAHAHLRSRVWALRGSLTAYDATYVALAETLEAPLLTADARLGRGARGLVETIVVGPSG